MHDVQYCNHLYIVPEKSIIEKITRDPYILPVQNVDKYGGGPGILHHLLIVHNIITDVQSTLRLL